MRKSKVDLLSFEEFNNIVQNSEKIKDVVIKLGYAKTGSNYKKVAERLLKEGLSLVKKTKWSCGNKKRPLDLILVENSDYVNRTHLKLRIIEEEVIEYKCEVCGCDGNWLGNSLTLQLDHKNGVNNDYRVENLRFLCPNCHSQTETYCGRNIKQK